MVVATDVSISDWLWGQAVPTPARVRQIEKVWVIVSRRLHLIYLAKWQAAQWPGVISRRGGISAWQRGNWAMGQRG
jgi:hypothetical protein